MKIKYFIPEVSNNWDFHCLYLYRCLTITRWFSKCSTFRWKLHLREPKMLW
jgi:hypothetical protein